MSARRPVIVRRQRAADVRLRAEGLEVVAGDELGAHALRLAVRHQRQRCGEPREHAAENSVLIAKIAIHRIGERPIVERASPECPRAVEQDETLGVLHGQKPQQHLVGQREDRGVRANPEREREDDDDRERGRFGERSKRIAEILREMHGCEYLPGEVRLSTKVFVE